MQIGKPIREIEVVPAVEPIPSALPVEEPRRAAPAPEPAPEFAPAEDPVPA